MTGLPRWPLTHGFALRDELWSAYGAPSRGHHNQQHLSEVLTHLDALADPGEDLTIVDLAAWFHDAVYDDRPEPEERSAQWAERALAALLPHAADVSEVARLVRLTVTHFPAPDDRAGQLLCDADLAILAADEDRYRTYVAGVRQEYAAIDQASFDRGRSSVLRELLGHPTLFSTERGRELYEERARLNLQREIEAVCGDANRQQ